MNNLLKIAAFSLAVIAVYTLFSVKYVPDMKPEAPPKDEAIDLSSMGLEGFTALGEKVYNGKGACTLCHNPVGGRAPLIEDIAAVAAERLKDPKYKGAAKDTEGYIRESMINPSAYVVAGFGAAGTDDTVSPMPDVTSGAIGLSELEVNAVIAYLQKKAGVEPTAMKAPAEAKE
ncbi:MAG: hypothetical protein HY954_08090 [Deltaproteobacteria bacterium]|nr:hypothetical protein [Deltaproteobacteria bacterium]